MVPPDSFLRRAVLPEEGWKMGLARQSSQRPPVCFFMPSTTSSLHHWLVKLGPRRVFAERRLHR